jgi:hypothetical protein
MMHGCGVPSERRWPTLLNADVELDVGEFRIALQLRENASVCGVQRHE